VAEATFLDLAMREYLALRDEMNDMRRQASNVITTALLAAAAAAAAVGGGLFGPDLGTRGLLMLLIAAGTVGVGLWATGSLNACKILELQIDKTAAAIRAIALTNAPDGAASFLSFQLAVRAFTKRAMGVSDRGALAAWLSSYAWGSKTPTRARTHTVTGADAVLLRSGCPGAGAPPGAPPGAACPPSEDRSTGTPVH
jgi:hypothetical protein